MPQWPGRPAATAARRPGSVIRSRPGPAPPAHTSSWPPTSRLPRCSRWAGTRRGCTVSTSPSARAVGPEMLHQGHRHADVGARADVAGEREAQAAGQAAGPTISRAEMYWLLMSPRTRSAVALGVGRSREAADLQRRVAFLVQVLDAGPGLPQRIDQHANGPLLHAGGAGEAAAPVGHGQIGRQEAHDGAGIFGARARRCRARRPAGAASAGCRWHRRGCAGCRRRPAPAESGRGWLRFWKPASWAVPRSGPPGQDRCMSSSACLACAGNETLAQAR